MSIFMKVSDMEDLKGRILRRGEMSEEELARRMESAQAEFAQAGECDHQVENVWGKANQSVRDVEQIMREEIDGMF